MAWFAPSYYLRISKPNLKPRTRVIIVADSYVLLIKNSVGSQQWTLPGGGYHRQETAKNCAKREVREELGINLDLVKPIGKTSEDSKGVTWNYDCFISHIKTLPQIHLSLELSEAKWFPISELPIAIRPYTLELIHLHLAPISTV